MASSKEFITITLHSQYLIIALTISLPLLTFFIDMQIQHNRNQSEPPIQKPATLPKDFVKLPSGKNSSQFIPTAKPRPSSGVSYPGCGRVDISSNEVQENQAGAESCFFQAFQQRSSATLTLLDTNDREHDFTIQNNGGTCHISVAEFTYSSPFEHVNPQLKNYTCTTVTKQKGGLLFSNCGAENNVFVPPPQELNTITSCEEVATSPDNSVAINPPLAFQGL